MGKLSDYEQGYTDANKYGARVDAHRWAIERVQYNRPGLSADDQIKEAQKLLNFVSGKASAAQARRQSPPSSKQYASKRGSA